MPADFANGGSGSRERCIASVIRAGVISWQGLTFSVVFPLFCAAERGAEKHCRLLRRLHGAREISRQRAIRTNGRGARWDTPPRCAPQRYDLRRATIKASMVLTFVSEIRDLFECKVKQILSAQHSSSFP